MIEIAVRRGHTLYVYGDQKRLLFTVPLGSGQRDGLLGYTSATVNVQLGSTIYTYSSHGGLISVTPTS
ncbi:MAG: hypothetical protein B7Y12_04110 [Rhizobiales bacterium 24-66-13]|nr:MAG: hypothetical protein B7Y61_02865 [Rhizobiales bacterium 35-66-30]OYZ82282.1 MAG: hypothetical protein B7Y12_04110 [Rhizobiales bacterium 24-66-13]OZB11081.1 MAG: hypothetical protein B7X67_05340 [Rhizobiales bacterium 39-66-18]